MAAALEQRIVRFATRIDGVSSGDTADKRDKAARAKSVKRVKMPFADDDALLAKLPTEADIAELMRHRSIGEVLEAICHDIGLVKDDEVWLDVERALSEFGGNFIRLWDDYIARRDNPPPIVREELDDIRKNGPISGLLGKGTYRRFGSGPPAVGPPERAAA